MQFPKQINKGDTIGILAPSSPYEKYDLIEIEKKFQELGYRVVFGASASASYRGYLAGTDEIRAKDINDMFYNGFNSKFIVE